MLHNYPCRTVLLCLILLHNTNGYRKKESMKRQRMLSMGESSKNRRPVSDIELPHCEKGKIQPNPAESYATREPVVSNSGTKPVIGSRRGVVNTAPNANAFSFGYAVYDSQLRPHPRRIAVGADREDDDPPSPSSGRNKYRRQHKPAMTRGLKSVTLSYRKGPSLDDFSFFQPLYPSETPTTLIHYRPSKPIA